MFYPKLGMYINALPCDQTIEVEWVDYRRTWDFNVKYTGEYKDKDGLSRTFQRNMCDNETEIERIPLWGDDLLVYGVWDTMPNWKICNKTSIKNYIEELIKKDLNNKYEDK